MASHSTDADARPYRNSDDEEGSRRSRARVSRACTRCRSRKDKCDAHQPQCSNCVNAGQSCLYVAATKKRGLPEGYVRGLEKLWAIMLQKVDGLDNAVRRVVDEHEDELLRIWNHHKLGDDLHTAWKDSSVLRDLERLLSRIDNTPPDLKRKRDREDGETARLLSDSPGTTDALTPDFKVTDMSTGTSQIGGFHPTLGQVHQTEDRHMEFAPPRTSHPSSASINLDAGSVPASTLASNSLSPKIILLPSFAPNLLDQYFTYTHCWLPILDRPHILRKFYEHTRSRNPMQLDTGDLACLWAICAYTQQQTKHLGLQQGPDEAAVKMRTIARGLIPSESGPFLIGHVQALLLLVLLDVGLGDWTSAWMLVGYAVRASLDTTETSGLPQLGMTRTDSVLTEHGGLKPGTVNRQKWLAVLQGCFILDTLISLRLGRPPHLRSKHLELHSKQLLDEDGHDEWEPWGIGARNIAPFREPAFVISCFNRLTELLMIANDAADTARHDETPGDYGAEPAISRLSSLSDRYPFPVVEVVPRPPHQLLLQACHLSVRASLPQTHIHVHQSVALQWCSIFELFERSFNLPSTCGMPSLLVPAYLLIEPLVDNVLSWSHSASLNWESYNKSVSGLAIIWPGLKAFRTSNVALSAAATTPSRTGGASDTLISGMLPISPPGANIEPVSSAMLDHFTSHTAYPLAFAPPEATDYDPVLERPQQHGAPDYRPMSIDLPSQDHHAGYGLDTAAQKGSVMGFGTSPSFNGDEIDALFHEMAQLDTTEWTMDRTQGLKDFGFADDSTFEAFCNDPDRLMLSDGDMGPAFNNGGIVPSGSQPSAMKVGGAQLGRMSYEDIFR